MSIFSTVSRSEPVKPCFNIGAGFDVPTASVLRGKYGESIMNGGYTIFNGMAGTGNVFKSAMLEWQELAAQDRINYALDIIPDTLKYDTEINKNEDHIRTFAQEFPTFKIIDPISSGNMVITDKSKYSGNKFFEIMKETLKQKDNSKEAIILPFLDRDNKTLYKCKFPTFGGVDSLTEFDTDAERTMGEENELGESGANTLFMKSGLFKTRFLIELSPIIHSSMHFMGMVAQIGNEISIQTGPMPAAPKKSLGAMKNGEVMKNVTSKFSFLTSILYQPISAKGLFNGSRMEDGPLYPMEKSDKDFKAKNDNDLFEIQLKCLRNKNGPTGFTMTVILSQSLGVQRELTEFHYIKERRFGFEGNLQNYNLVLYPDVKLSRTTVRRKLADDYKLKRAVNILSELLQFRDLKPVVIARDDINCSPEELYKDLKDQGYDWDVLLNTRGWYCPNNDDPKLIPFLSTIDLLRMRKGLYFPYWVDPATKQRKPEFANSKPYE